MAYSFTAASSQRVSGTPAIDLSSATNATLFFSGKRTSGTYQGVGYDKGTGAGGGDRYVISWFTNNQLYIVMDNSAQGLVNVSDAGTGAYNEAGTYNGTIGTASNRLQLFKNGSSLSNSGTGTIDATLPASIGVFYIGYSVVDNAYATGDISEVAVWNVTLTTAEIASLGKGFKPSRVRPQSLIFYTPLIRNAQDVRGGVTLTVSNSPPATAHPRVY